MTKQRVFRLDFPNPMLDFNHSNLVSERETWSVDDPYDVVVLNIEAVRKLTLLGGQVWPGHPSKINRECEMFGNELVLFSNMLRPSHRGKSNRKCFMPRISPTELPPSRFRQWLNHCPLAPKKTSQWAITFGNGRHRTEFLRAQGVIKMPFETRKKYIPTLIEICRLAEAYD